MLLMNKKNHEVIEVTYDNCPESPLEWDRLGTLRLFNDCYDDTEDYQKEQTLLDGLDELIGDHDIHDVYADNNNAKDFFAKVQKLGEENGYYIEPVSKHDHGLVDYYIGVDSGWDVSIVGFIYARYDKITKHFDLEPGKLPEFSKVEEIFAGELKDYSDWANGIVYELDYYLTPTNLVDTEDYIGGIYNDNFTEDAESCNADNIKAIITDANYYFDLTDANPNDWSIASERTERIAYIAS